MLLFAIIGVIIVVIIVLGLLLIFKKKPAAKTNQTSKSGQTTASLATRLSKLDPCSLISDPKVLSSNNLSLDPVGSMDTDDYHRPHCFFQSVVNNQLQYELETIIHLDTSRDPLAPTLQPLSNQTTGKFKTAHALGDYGDGRGTCNFIITLNDTYSVEVDAVVSSQDDAFTPACNEADYYGPIVVQQLTKDGF